MPRYVVIVRVEYVYEHGACTLCVRTCVICVPVWWICTYYVRMYVNIMGIVAECLCGVRVRILTVVYVHV